MRGLSPPGRVCPEPGEAGLKPLDTACADGNLNVLGPSGGMADALDSKSSAQKACGFESLLGHSEIPAVKVGR